MSVEKLAHQTGVKSIPLKCWGCGKELITGKVEIWTTKKGIFCYRCHRKQGDK